MASDCSWGGCVRRVASARCTPLVRGRTRCRERLPRARAVLLLARVCVCVSVVAPHNCAPTAVLRPRGPRVGRPRVIYVGLARSRRRPRPPACRTAGHAAGGREVCDPRGAHGASGQRCVPAHGLRCRCGCGAVRESVGRVRVRIVACVALVWLLLCRAQAGVVRPMQGVVAPFVGTLDLACCGCHTDGCARSGGAACRGGGGGGGGDRARGS